MNKIEQFIRNDLSEYPCYEYPLSKTVVNGISWRHYELGSICGFIIYNVFNHVEEKEVIKIAYICNDDGNWFSTEKPMNLNVRWIDDIFKTLDRAKIWYECVKEGMKIEPQVVIPKFKPSWTCQIDGKSTSNYKYNWPWYEWWWDDVVILDYCKDFFKKPWYICKNLTRNEQSTIPEEILKLKED